MIKSTILISFLLLCGGADARGCDLDLDGVLERYVLARGGAEAIEKQKALRLVSTNHEGEWNPKFDYRVMRPGYMWITATYDDGEVIVEGFDGERGWEKWGEKPAEYVGGGALRGLKAGARSPVHLYGLHEMTRIGAKVTLEGCTSIDDQHYYVIKVAPPLGTETDYYINAKTFINERARSSRAHHPTVDPTEITIEERWSDFDYVNGVLHPFGYSQWDVDANKRLNWLEVHTIEPLNDITQEFFRKP